MSATREEEPTVALEPTVQETCAVTHRALSMRKPKLEKAPDAFFLRSGLKNVPKNSCIDIGAKDCKLELIYWNGIKIYLEFN